MGIVCELHRASDALIEQIAAYPAEAATFVTDNFNSIYGKHHNDDTITYLGKGWDIAFFLLKEADPSSEKVLSGWRGEAFDEKDFDTPYYLKAAQVKVMAPVLAEITEGEIKDAFNYEKMREEYVYRAHPGIPENWDWIIELANDIISAFQKAAEANDGLIINFS